MAKGRGQREEVVLQIPDIGLSQAQLVSLKKAFRNELVSSMGGKAAARARTVVVRIRIIVQRAQL